MNKRQFLSGLEELWRDTMFYDISLNLEDLLDDAATLGVEGASELYLHMLKEGDEIFQCIHGLTKKDGCSCHKACKETIFDVEIAQGKDSR